MQAAGRRGAGAGGAPGVAAEDAGRWARGAGVMGGGARDGARPSGERRVGRGPGRAPAATRGTAADGGAPAAEGPAPVKTARSGPRGGEEAAQRSGGQAGLGEPFQLPVLLQLPHPAGRRGRGQDAGRWRWPRGAGGPGRGYLCRQRRRNLMIFRAAWSCFLVRKEPLLEGRSDEQTWPAGAPRPRSPAGEGGEGARGPTWCGRAGCPRAGGGTSGSAAG